VNTANKAKGGEKSTLSQNQNNGERSRAFRTWLRWSKERNGDVIRGALRKGKERELIKNIGSFRRDSSTVSGALWKRKTRGGSQRQGRGGKSESQIQIAKNAEVFAEQEARAVGVSCPRKTTNLRSRGGRCAEPRRKEK